MGKKYMVKKKSEDKETKTSPKKTIKKDNSVDTVKIEKFTITELLEKNNIKPLKAVGFLTYYGLIENFRREYENNERVVEFSEGEFNDMYKRYMEREI